MDNDVRDMVISWIEERAVSAEMTDDSPHDALAIARMALSADRKPSPATSRLVESLEELVKLYDDHQLNLKLEKYQSMSPAAIAFKMLDNCTAIIVLSDVVSKHFAPYLASHGLPSEDLLEEYIDENIIFESRACALIPCLTNKSSQYVMVCYVVMVRIDKTCEILTRAKMPLTSHVKALIDNIKSRIDIVSPKLQAQYKVIELKTLAFEYGFSEFNGSDISHAIGFIRHIMSM